MVRPLSQPPPPPHNKATWGPLRFPLSPITARLAAIWYPPLHRSTPNPSSVGLVIPSITVFPHSFSALCCAVRSLSPPPAFVTLQFQRPTLRQPFFVYLCSLEEWCFFSSNRLMIASPESLLLARIKVRFPPPQPGSFILPSSEYFQGHPSPHPSFSQSVSQSAL